MYCIRHIFRESNFSQIGTSRRFHEWLNSRSRRRAKDGEISIIHSFARALCTVLLVLLVHKSHSCVGNSGSKVNFVCVVEFVNSTRLTKFAKIKPLQNIWRIQYFPVKLSLLKQPLTHYGTSPLKLFSIKGLHYVYEDKAIYYTDGHFWRREHHRIILKYHFKSQDTRNILWCSRKQSRHLLYYYGSPPGLPFALPGFCTCRNSCSSFQRGTGPGFFARSVMRI